MNGDPDVLAVSGQMLINRVIYDLKDTVVQAALIGVTDIHAGAKTDGFEALKLLNLIGTVGLIVGYSSGV